KASSAIWHNLPFWLPNCIGQLLRSGKADQADAGTGRPAYRRSGQAVPRPQPTWREVMRVAAMTGRRLPIMTSDELAAIVRKAVRDELNDAGLRLDDANHQFEAREDFRFLRKLRQSFHGASSKIGATVLVALVSGVLWLIWIGFQAIFPNR